MSVQNSTNSSAPNRTIGGRRLFAGFFRAATVATCLIVCLLPATHSDAVRLLGCSMPDDNSPSSSIANSAETSSGLATQKDAPISAGPESAAAPAKLGRYKWEALGEAPQSSSRAWDSRPYQVAVWVCHQGQPELAAVEDRLLKSIESSCRLLDASSWFVTAGTPPSPTRIRLLKTIQQPLPDGAFETDPMLAHYDKLMVVSLVRKHGQTKIVIRECDLQTGQWGPIVDLESSNISSLGSLVAGGVAKAFMPLAKIDRVDTDSKVHILPRATETCVRVEFVDETTPKLVPVTSSPVYIRSSDRFLPIIRKTDRNGNLKSLDPIEFTFLTIDKIEENALVASIHSRDRAPLAQRKSKRAQKLALVIRPVERPSILHLESTDKVPKPLEGYEVWARKPGDTKEVESTFLGKTDWQGNIEVPPSPEGLRLIYIKRGSRALRKLPIIPGFKDRLVSKLPNDDARLFAEGVIRGYGNEIINLVVQRELLQSEIEGLVEQEKYEDAGAKLMEYKNLETPTDMKRRMSSEEVRLKSMTNDPREFKYISEMFQSLKDLLNSKVVSSREIELQEKIQNQTLEKASKG